jgi:peptidoglycan/LPS O-acetylase OafA/YrhL
MPMGIADGPGRRGETLNGFEGSPYRSHIPAIDGVRGVAVLGVMASHLFYFSASTSSQRFVQSVLEFGATGVDIFFVLSGFLITGILYDSLCEGRYFQKFYARRTLRIFPLYYGVLFVALMTTLFQGKHYHRELLSLALYVQNTHWIAVPISMYAGPPGLPLQHFWSLAVEEQFYLVWPLLIYLLRRPRPILMACAAGALLCFVLRFAMSLEGAPYLAINGTTACHLDTLLGGGALAMLLRGPWHDRILAKAGWLFAVCAGLSIVFDRCGSLPLGPLERSLLFSTALTTMALMFFALLALALRRGSVVASGFSVGWLRQFGKYSYGIYVLHYVLGSVLHDPLKQIVHAHVSSKAAGVLLPGFLVFVLSLVAAYLSYNYYERPFLRLKRYFEYRRNAPQQEYSA